MEQRQNVNLSNFQHLASQQKGKQGFIPGQRVGESFLEIEQDDERSTRKGKEKKEQPKYG